MANAFTKEEKVAFDDMLEGFNDALVMSSLVNKFSLGEQEAERGSDVIWRPVPYIAQSYSGLDQSSNFGDSIQLSVPSQIGTIQSSNFTLNASELRDPSQADRKTTAARTKLASDINIALMNTAANEGTVVIANAGAATGYDDVALADAAFNERGVPFDDRYMALSSRDYNAMAGNLAARSDMKGKPTRAYENSYVGRVAGFETHKLDYATRLTAATGTTVTLNAAAAADRHYTPVSTTTSANGINQTNVDNRYQVITIAVTSGTVKAGDAFKLAGVNSVHMITKEDTGQPQTFRVIEVLTGSGGSGTVKISPPIITNDTTTTAADEQYKNCSATPANGAAITFLNIADAAVNPFWRKDAIELLPSKLIMPTNSGMDTMSGTTDQGVSVLMTRQGAIGTLSVQYRLDVFYGTVATCPDQMGIELFGQT